MNRRTALIWLTRILGALSLLVVAIPGGAFVWNTVRRRKGEGALVRRVARLDDLATGQPREVLILDKWRDAWTVHSEQTVGRVWLVRRSGSNVGPEKSVVDAFSAVCPHMGCDVAWVAGDQRFFCPCHNGAFESSGEPMSAEKLKAKNPVPRPLDKLPCRLVEIKQGDTSEWWVEVTYEQYELGKTEKVAKA